MGVGCAAGGVAAVHGDRWATGSGVVAGRFWVSPAGYTPVDAAAARVGDARYDVGVDCAQRPTPARRRRSRPSWP